MRLAYGLAAALATASIAPAAVAAQDAPDAKDKMICKSVKATGSRLNRERVCMTKAQWDKHFDEGRKATGEVVNNLPPPPPSQ